MERIVSSGWGLAAGRPVPPKRRIVEVVEQGGRYIIRPVTPPRQLITPELKSTEQRSTS